MVVRILSDCRADGRHLASGEVVDISEEAARSLIAIGRAQHDSLTIEDVASAVTAAANPPARRGRPPATPNPNIKED